MFKPKRARVTPLTKIAAALLGIALATTLTACDSYTNHPSDGGLTSAEVQATLEAVPGIQHADAYSVPWYSPGEGGLGSSRGVDLLLWVTIDPEMHIYDHVGFLRTAMQAAWSINDGYSPDGSVIVIIRRGADVDYDWRGDLETVLGHDGAVTRGADVRYAFSGYAYPPQLAESDLMVGASDDAYTEAFGAWPADPIHVGAGLLAAGPPESVEPAAVREWSVWNYSFDDTSCVNVTFERNVNDLGLMYTGDVTVILKVDGDEHGTDVAWGEQVAESGGAGGVSFCDEGLPRTSPERVTAHIVAPAEPGFRGVDVDDVTGR
jgi:hypothetical protein